jgi:hypothetical protein
MDNPPLAVPLLEAINVAVRVLDIACRLVAGFLPVERKLICFCKSLVAIHFTEVIANVMLGRSEFLETFPFVVEEFLSSACVKISEFSEVNVNC